MTPGERTVADAELVEQVTEAIVSVWGRVQRVWPPGYVIFATALSDATALFAFPVAKALLQAERAGLAPEGIATLRGDADGGRWVVATGDSGTISFRMRLQDPTNLH